MELFAAIKPTILVVDHSEAELDWIGDVLRPSYRVKSTRDGIEALRLCQHTAPDLVLADVTLPNPDGYELLRCLKVDTRTSDIPVMYLASKHDFANDLLGIDWGDASFLMRPLQPRLLLARLRAHFVEASHTNALWVDNEYLESEVQRRVRQVNVMQNVTIMALAALAEVRDVDTGNHLRRTQNYVLALGSHLVGHPRFAAHLRGDRVQTLYHCAPLHDIGKVGIPDRVLLKHGRYTPEEYHIMKMHPKLGLDAIEAVQNTSDAHLDFLTVAKEIVYGHHERWDGTGYPQGLEGDAIPVSARLMALADMYDALISRRVYKKGMSHEQASAVIVQGRGHHFDPDVVDAFLTLGQVFKAIATRYADTDDDLERKARLLLLARDQPPTEVAAASSPAELVATKPVADGSQVL